MRLCVVVKSDMVYKKIKQIFSDYEVLTNASHFMELSEIVRSEEINIAVIEEGVHWRNRAENYLNDYSIPFVIFTGNFDELIEKVRASTYDTASATPMETPVQEKKAEESSKEEFEIPAKQDKTINLLESRKNQVPKLQHNTQLKKEDTSQDRPVQTIEVIREVPKYIEKVKEIPVEKVVERIKEVPVETVIEREVLKTEIVEIKPNFDSVDVDFELPSIVPEVPIQLNNVSQIDSVQGPLFIGVMAVETDIDVSNLVFMIATSLAVLGHTPLVIGDDKEEIESLEQLIFKNDEDDHEAEIFESEGVSYMRNGVQWEYSELMTGGFSHIIHWYESLEKPRGQQQYVEWTRSHVPLLISSGQSWKITRLQEILNQCSEATLKRSRLLLNQAQIVKALNREYPGLSVDVIPFISDPFSPAKQHIAWVRSIINASKIRKFNFKLVIIFILACGISALFIWLGLQI